MKVVLLKSLRINGVRFSPTTNALTVIELDESDFESLAALGVVRPLSDTELPEPEPEPQAKTPRKKASKIDADEDL